MRYVKCAKCGREYHSCAVQKCTQRAVVAQYGTDICMYCCRGCKHNIHQDTFQLCALREKARLKKTEAEPAHLENDIKKDALNGN